MRRFVLIGAGIVGLSTARAIQRLDPGAEVSVLEKETRWAAHQSGHNSGVIHSGIYYRPGSAKARMCRAGSERMLQYVQANGIPVEQCGKLIVATSRSQLAGLESLFSRGQQNDIAVVRLTIEEAREFEPAVTGVGAIRVPAAAITDYGRVCDRLAAEIASAGGRIHLGVRALSTAERPTGALVIAEDGAEFDADVIVNCGGLQSDRIAAQAGIPSDTRIVPFRGEYYELRADRAHLVKGMIYPVPDPAFPFLGVHLTRSVSGSVHVGPNAVLALAREGYRWSDVQPGDVASIVGFGGFWKLARRHGRQGAAEITRSLSRRRFAAAVAKLVPAITASDLVPSAAGVRAQALRQDGSLVDDFLIVRSARTVHVLNAPSPAATSAFEIGDHIANLAVS